MKALLSTCLVCRKSAAAALLITCLNGAGATVDCATGDVRTVQLRATGVLLSGVSYTITVNPDGAPTVIVDPSGNAASTTSKTFVLST